MLALIKRIKKELYAKPAPGEVLNNITEKKLKELAKRYEHNHDALWLGAYLADLFIWEAKESGDITKHVPMAIDYARTVIKKNKIGDEEADIILEIIKTHHGGKQKHIESKLYKNADCFKFLDPKGVFHIFSAFYDNTEKGCQKAGEYAMFKVEEKYRLIDLDEELKEEAKMLYDRWQWFFDKMGYELKTPDLYKKK